MTPSWFQVPPNPPAESQIVCTDELRRSTDFSRPSAKNPTCRLSGDQKGSFAPSVPVSCCALDVESARTQRAVFPSGPSATNASLPPSGEMTKL